MSGDTKPESDESFFVNLSNPTGADFDPNAVGVNALGTIIDDDTAPKHSFSNVSITEGNSGTTNAVFTVQRSGNLAQRFTLSYSTSDGTATTADLDYVATSGVLDFAQRDIKTFTVAVIGIRTSAGTKRAVNLSTRVAEFRPDKGNHSER